MHVCVCAHASLHKLHKQHVCKCKYMNILHVCVREREREVKFGQFAPGQARLMNLSSFLANATIALYVCECVFVYLT